MDSSRFKRGQWSSQSVRVTARELSLVKPKNAAIMERFSKYQKAAEESSLEKKRGNTETLPHSFTRGSLSVLRKKWEIPGNPSRIEPVQSATSPRRLKVSSPKVEATIADPSESDKVHSPVKELSRFRYPSGSERRTYSMEDNSVEHNLENADAPQPSPKIEKFNVPLNSLKMMFEKGEAGDIKPQREPGKINTGRIISENCHTEDSDVLFSEKSSSACTSPDHSPSKLTAQKSIEIAHVLETTSLKDRMAKYQAALSKQTKPPSPSNDTKNIWNEVKSQNSEHKENVPPTSPHAGLNEHEKRSSVENSLVSSRSVSESNGPHEEEIQRPSTSPGYSPQGRALNKLESTPPKVIKTDFIDHYFFQRVIFLRTSVVGTCTPILNFSHPQERPVSDVRRPFTQWSVFLPISRCTTTAASGALIAPLNSVLGTMPL
uniref:Uncharacterized protein n=1 Tax=Leptobrachium leishanense TaxID=445787 RepID=A0A8C5LRF4_9ANUR